MILLFPVIFLLMSPCYVRGMLESVLLSSCTSCIRLCLSSSSREVSYVLIIGITSISSTIRMFSPWPCSDLVEGDEPHPEGFRPHRFDMLPPGFSAVDFSSNWSSFTVKTQPAQQHDALSLIENHLQLCTSNTWSPTVEEAVQAWWEGHLNAELVRFSMALHGLPYTTATSKRDMIAVLMRYQAPPIPCEQMMAMFNLWHAASDDDKSFLEQQIPPEHAIPVPDSPVAFGTSVHNAPSGPAAVLQSDIPAGAGNAFVPPISAVDFASSITGLNACITALKAMTESHLAVSSQASADSKEDDENAAAQELLNHEQKLLAKVSASIEARSYYDIMALNEDNLSILRFRTMSGSKVKASSIGGGFSIVSGEHREKDWSKNFDWTLWKSGFYRWISLLGASSVPHLVTDRMNWFIKLESLSDIAPACKTKYARFFSLKHAKAVNWESLFDTDSYLFHTLTAVPAEDGGKRRRGSPRRDEPSAGGRGSPKRKLSKAHCNTRTDSARGQCTYTFCRFSHRCACCGKNHAAADCSRWDDAVAAKNVSTKKWLR